MRMPLTDSGSAQPSEASCSSAGSSTVTEAVSVTPPATGSSYSTVTSPGPAWVRVRRSCV